LRKSSDEAIAPGILIFSREALFYQHAFTIQDLPAGALQHMFHSAGANEIPAIHYW
jgi:hypothetical protein